jgi:hypothetical protein
MEREPKCLMVVPRANLRKRGAYCGRAAPEPSCSAAIFHARPPEFEPIDDAVASTRSSEHPARYPPSKARTWGYGLVGEPAGKEAF